MKRALEFRAASLRLKSVVVEGGGGYCSDGKMTSWVFFQIPTNFLPQRPALQMARHLVLFFFCFFFFQGVLSSAAGSRSYISLTKRYFRSFPPPSGTHRDASQKPKRLQNASQTRRKRLQNTPHNASAISTDKAAKEGGGGPAGRAQGGGAKQKDRSRR